MMLDDVYADMRMIYGFVFGPFRGVIYLYIYKTFSRIDDT